jgi:hypothetical protein
VCFHLTSLRILRNRLLGHFILLVSSPVPKPLIRPWVRVQFALLNNLRGSRIHSVLEQQHVRCRLELGTTIGLQHLCPDEAFEPLS